MEEKQLKKKQSEELEGISDLVMIFIGASLIILGVLNMFAEVPPAFILGATLSGLFFTFADPSLFSKRLSNDVSQVISLCFTALAVFSFFLLPVVLLISPTLYEIVKPFGDLATFVALGGVIIVLGVKTRNTNRSRFEKLIAEKDRFIETNKFLVDRNNEMMATEFMRQSAESAVKIAEELTNTTKPSDE